MKRSIAMFLVCAFALEAVSFAGLGSDKTAYVGGRKTRLRKEQRANLQPRRRRILALSIKAETSRYLTTR